MGEERGDLGEVLLAFFLVEAVGGSEGEFDEVAAQEKGLLRSSPWVWGESRSGFVG